MDYAAIAAAIAAGVFWAKGAEIESVSPLIWVGASVVISALVMFVLHQGWLGVLAGQFTMFIGIGVWRALTDKTGKSED